MAQNVHCHSTRKNGGLVRKYYSEARLKASRTNSKSFISMTYIKRIDSSTPPAFISLLNWFHSLFVDPFGRYPIALTPAILWDHPGLAFKASCNAHFRVFWPLRQGIPHHTLPGLNSSLK